MKGVRNCSTAALLLVAFSYTAIGQQLAANELLPDAPSYKLQTTGEPQSAAPQEAKEEGTASVRGVVTDSPGDVIPGAKVELTGEGKSEPHITTSEHDGSFSFTRLPAGRYNLIITGANLEPYDSGEFEVKTGEAFEVPKLALKFATNTTVNVNITTEEIAQEQIHEQEKQRVLGIVPNFYTSYVWDAAPMTATQKFTLSGHALGDPTTFLIVAGIAGAEQVHGTYPGYGDGPEGYGKRYGAALADVVIGRFMGAAVLPAVFHQDPRYFYQGSGGVGSRSWHAITSAFVTRGDNGRLQPSYSHILGNLIAGGVANAYHPEASRGASLTFQTWALTTGGSAISNLFREFLFRRLSPSVPAFANGKK